MDAGSCNKICPVSQVKKKKKNITMNEFSENWDEKYEVQFKM